MRVLLSPDPWLYDMYLTDGVYGMRRWLYAERWQLRLLIGDLLLWQYLRTLLNGHAGLYQLHFAHRLHRLQRSLTLPAQRQQMRLQLRQLSVRVDLCPLFDDDWLCILHQLHQLRGM